MAVAFFASFGTLASVLGYRTAGGASGTIGFLPFLSVALVSPNWAACVVVLFSALTAELLAKRARIKAVFNVAQHVLAEAMAVGTYVLLGGRSMLDGDAALGAFIAMVAVFFAINRLAVSTVVGVSTGTSTSRQWWQSMRESTTYDLFASPLIYVYAKSYALLGIEWSAVLALPFLGLRQLYKQSYALQKINEELLQLMVATVEAQDPYTSGHSQRVSRYAKLIAKFAGVNSRQSSRIATAALLHDVGKIYEEFFPILRKPGRLTDAEFEVMKSHSAKGAALIAKVSHFEDLVPLILHHHEAWDGTGYPMQIRGEALPLGARIIALADTIDAMSTSRPYRAALSAATVRAELMSESGRQFDPSLCDAVLAPGNWSLLIEEMENAKIQYPVVHRPTPVNSRLEALLIPPKVGGG
ncbi:MAG: HD-GYP domain-containing protein [Gemmatimonadaceae bacterium]|nr:HD-GYP domain-containing protein [Gemmatimonadaceae bacterium]